MTSTNYPTQKDLLNIIAKHQMTIVRDDGLYRHLVFFDNGSAIYRFEIVTWPGYLAYTGDMGAYVFSRVADMFTFFRNDREAINPEYWSEKVVAEGTSDGIEHFSIEAFRENVLRHVCSRLNLQEESEIPAEIMEEIEDILDAEDMFDAIGAVRKFTSEKINFNDFWEYHHNRYTRSFILCCYAIVWAIGQYDAAHNPDVLAESKAREICELCNGEGVVNKDDWIMCYECRGTGYTPGKCPALTSGGHEYRKEGTLEVCAHCGIRR